MHGNMKMLMKLVSFSIWSGKFSAQILVNYKKKNQYDLSIFQCKSDQKDMIYLL